MPKWLKVVLRIAGIFLALVVVLWLAVAAYVYSHKKELLQKVTTQLNENLNGTLTIESMEPELIRGFPGISVSLKNVLLRDSLWARHKHDLIKAEDIYIAVDVFSIVTGNPSIKKISIQNGSIYLFTDSSGTGSIDLLKKKRDEQNEKSRRRVNRIELNHVRFTYQNLFKHKLYHFMFDRLRADIRYKSGGWNGRLQLKTRVNNLAFNTTKGSFIKGRYMVTDLRFSYQKADHRLSIPMQDMSLDQEKLKIGGDFLIGPDVSAFKLKVFFPAVRFRNAASLLTPHIAYALRRYNLTKPLEAGATISGRLKNGGDPLVRAWWKVNHNDLKVSGESLTDCSFTGGFTNQVRSGVSRDDPNSLVYFNALSGRYFDIPFKADSVQIFNLKQPVISGRFISDFSLSKLNAVLRSERFHFSRGTAHLNIFYKAPFNPDDSGPHFINGNIRIRNAGLKYQPRNLSFNNLQSDLNFRGQDLFLRNTRFQSGTSRMSMEGSMRNFLNFYYSDPQKILLELYLKSPNVNMNEFLSFLGKRRTSISQGSTVSRIARRLDRMLDQADAHLNINVDRVVFKRFVANRVTADVTLREAGIVMKDVRLRHGNGSLKISGFVDQSRPVNHFEIKGKVENADVRKLFYSFENFGQSGITDQNLRGVFFAETDVRGLMRDNGTIIPGSFYGTVNFDLRKGAIVNFDPMEKIGAFAFPNRNFSNITFNNLKNTLDIRGTKVIIRPMRIESSVLNVFLEGVYGFSSGTNISMQIPLRNPKKDAFIADDTLREKRSRRGIIIYLKAVDGEDGKVKFKLGKGEEDRTK